MPTAAPGPEGRTALPTAFQRGEAIYEVFLLAVKLAPHSVASKTGYALGEILKGLLPGLLEMLVVVGVTTAIGGTAGGVLGFFFGGAGAAPGVVVGGEIGFNIGMAALTWLGVGFLAAAIAQGLGELWSSLLSGVEHAWHAAEQPPREYPHEITRAAKEIADSVGILMLLILQGLVAWVLKRAAVKFTSGAFAAANKAQSLGAQAAADAALAEALVELRSSKLGGGFADWVEQNWRMLRDDPRLRLKQQTVSNSKGLSSETSFEPRPEPRLNKKTYGDTPLELIFSRLKVAEEFYRNQGFDDLKIRRHMRGIDFTKSVRVVTLAPGKKLVQFQTLGGQRGNYYGLSGSSPTSLGITEKTLNEATGQIVDKIKTQLIVDKNIEVLESTAAPIKDTWSIPGQRIQTKGGGIQYFSTEDFTH